MITGMRRGIRWIFFNIKYFGQPPWDTGITPPEVLAFLGAHPPGRALDLGCGTGVNLLSMAQAGWQVTGVDYALRAVWAARQKLKQGGFQAQVLVGDVTGLRGLHGPFDLALDIGCYHGIAVQDRPAYRANLLRWLAPGGYFLIYAHLVDALQPGGFGLAPEDMRGIEQILSLRQRQDSLDRWGRRASWMTFQKKQQP